MIDIQEIKDEKGMNVCFSIRKEVFVNEQNCSSDEEFDGLDPECRHFLAFFDNKACGTARMRITDKGLKLERFAVLKEYRNLSVGFELVQRLLKEASGENQKYIYLHAQKRVENFYKKSNFYADSQPFMEANILHIRMVYKYKNP